MTVCIAMVSVYIKYSLVGIWLIAMHFLLVLVSALPASSVSLVKFQERLSV